MTQQPSHHGPSDERVEQVMGNLLRTGVIASALVVFSGGILFLSQDGRQPAPDFREFHSQPEVLRHPGSIFREAAALEPQAIMMLGLLLLIATPVARVIFSVVVFALQRDRLFVVFTLLVLAVLLYSLFHGYLTGRGGG